MEVYYSGSDHQIVEEQELGPIVRANRPIPRQGRFYFDVSIISTGSNKEIAIGVCVLNTPLDRFPGWTPFSFGYHGDDGNIFCESDEDPKYELNQPFNSGDVIGVCLDFSSMSLQFFKQNIEVQTVPLNVQHMDQDYYPCVGISSPGAIVRLNMHVGGRIFFA